MRSFRMRLRELRGGGEAQRHARKANKHPPRYARNGSGEGARSFSEKGRGTEAFTIRFGAWRL